MRDPVRRIFLFAFIQLVFLSACGGGSSDLTGGSGSTGTGTGSGQTIASAAANVAAITVDAGPSGVGADTTINFPYVSVTICAPGSTTNCETIDHIQVDTGSYGLRVIASAFTSSTVLNALPLETSIVGGALVECTQFADGISWGSMRTAGVQISGETVSSIPIQIIGDPNYPDSNIPSDCTSHGSPEDTIPLFGANGIIGVGPFIQDCPDCAGSTQDNVYFSCPVGGGACSDVEAPTTQQTANPVASFTTDNNGVIVELPPVADAGAVSVTGALVFGIGTQSNNALGSATVLTTDDVGDITITYKNVAYPDSYIDSGSTLIYLNDGSIAVCGTAPNQLFCPNSELSLSAVNEGSNNVQSTVNFEIADAETLLNNNPSFTAFDNVAAPNPDPQGFDFGLPFFYGRNVFVAISGATTSGGTGPYNAY
jgi:Protein of unknown function (DUF3443)